MATLMRSLRQIPFLQPLTDEQLIQLVEKGQRQAIVAGQVLFHKGMERERHRSLAQMVVGVAHEVNTPLGIINTAASIIKRELTSETVKVLPDDRKVQSLVGDLLETADLMQKNIVRAHTLIQSFKNLSVSQIADTKEALILPEVIDEILALFSIQARHARLDVTFTHTLPEAQCTWVGYRGHLSRIPAQSPDQCGTLCLSRWHRRQGRRSDP